MTPCPNCMSTMERDGNGVYRCENPNCNKECRCTKCGREKPSGITDPSCSVGGVCTWVTAQMHSDWIIAQQGGVEHCSVCGRFRPAYITDPTCQNGGYCNWVHTKTAPRVDLLDGLQASILEGDDKDLAEALGAATVNARKRIIDNVKQRILGSYDDNPIVFRAPLMIPEHQCYDEKNYRVWWTHSDKPFKIECLLLWGITLQTRIVFLYVGNDKAIPINAEPVSGMLYYTRLPPEELRDVIVNDQFAPRLEQKFDVQTLSPALRLRIAIEGPVSHIAFVGLTMR